MYKYPLLPPSWGVWVLLLSKLGANGQLADWFQCHLDHKQQERMADGEKDEEKITTHGNDWEVVSLTASVYAAYPGPNKLDEGEVDEQGELTYAQEGCNTNVHVQHTFKPEIEETKFYFPVTGMSY
ncbi:ATG8-interacting protein 2 [Nymphaea thermarum]|nr:ATG8-interacting protein 2 [Nymphaea thermarum]